MSSPEDRNVSSNVCGYKRLLIPNLRNEAVSNMSHKASKLILHFGLAKTGSTAIQKALFENRKHLLKNKNILYPCHIENHYYFQSMFSSYPENTYQIRMLGLPNKEAVNSFLEEYRRGFLNEVNETRPSIIIISSEYFSGMSFDEMKQMRSFLETVAEEISLFAYVRDPWSFSVSMLQEMIRCGSLDREVEFGYMESNIEIIRKFEEVFCKKAIIAPYIQHKENFNVVKDFFRRFDIQLKGDLDFSYKNINSSMMREAACVMLHLNRLYPVFDENEIFTPDGVRDWMVEAIQASPLAKTPIRISRRTADKIYEKCKYDINYLEENYFGGKKVFTEHYTQMEFDDFDDSLSITMLAPKVLLEYLLSCMRILSERAVYYHDHMTKNLVERLFWMGKYHALIGDIEVAKNCYHEVLSFHPHHEMARQELELLGMNNPTAYEPYLRRNLQKDD